MFVRTGSDSTAGANCARASNGCLVGGTTAWEREREREDFKVGQTTSVCLSAVARSGGSGAAPAPPPPPPRRKQGRRSKWGRAEDDATAEERTDGRTTTPQQRSAAQVQPSKPKRRSARSSLARSVGLAHFLTDDGNVVAASCLPPWPCSEREKEREQCGEIAVK